MSAEIKSTLNEPQYNATCKHCNQSFGDFTMEDLIKHLSEHEIGIHFEDITLKTKIVESNDSRDYCDECNEILSECTCEFTAL